MNFHSKFKVWTAQRRHV